MPVAGIHTTQITHRDKIFVNEVYIGEKNVRSGLNVEFHMC